MIDIGRPELPLDQSEILVLVHGAVMIAIRPGKIRGGQATPTKLRTGELTCATTIETLKQNLGRALGFIEIDGAVSVAIDGGEGAGPAASTRKCRGCREAACERKQE